MTTTYYRTAKRRQGLLASLKAVVMSIVGGYRGAVVVETQIAATDGHRGHSLPASDADMEVRERDNRDEDGRGVMVFRKESRHDSFQRQISALRQQLSADQDDGDGMENDSTPPLRFTPTPEAQFRHDIPAPLPSEVHPASADTGVIAAGSTWNGTLRSDGSVHVYGAVEGEVTAEHDVFVAEGATADARVSATTVIVAGRLGGTISCRNRLEVWPTGHISGDVSSPILVIHEGATVDGMVTMRPSKNSG